MAYDHLDPIGGYRHDLQTANLLYAQFGSDKYSFQDFLPVDPNPMTDEQRQAYEAAKRKAQLDAQTQKLIAHLSKSSKD